MAKIDRKVTLVLFLIVLLASFLRFFRLTSVPPSLFGDEVDIGYQAYSILKTGRDYYGNSWPVHFQSFGDWRTPLYLYLTVPSIAVFGLSDFAVRFPAAFFGVLGVVGTFFLAKELLNPFKKPMPYALCPIPLVSAFLLAISPWHLQYSRASFEVTLMSTLFIFALFFFLRWIKTQKHFCLFLSSFLFSLPPYAYNTAKLFIPLLLLALFFIYRKNFLKFKKQTILAALLFLIVLAPLAWDIFKGSGRARFSEISIFSDPKRIEWVAQKRGEEIRPKVAIVLYNKVIFWLNSFTHNYLKAFSPQFLFLTGDPNLRHSLGERGELYLLGLPFLLLGWWVFFQEKTPGKKLLLSWFLLAPLPASLTQSGGNHATRLFLLLPIFQMVTALGLVSFWQKTKFKKLFLLNTAFLFTTSLFLYLHEYYVHYPKASARWWNFGYKEAFAYTESVQDEYERIYLTQSYEPTLLYFLYYTRFDPSQFHKDGPTPDRLGKYLFNSGELVLSKAEPLEENLFVLAPSEVERFRKDYESFALLEEVFLVKNPKGEVVFKILASKTR